MSGIKFENIDNGNTILISPDNEGKYYGAKLSAAINSSNLSLNADRGQDFGWRLDPEQQALIETWENDPDMIERVSQRTKVPMESLTHADFLTYLVYQQTIGTSPERKEIAIRRERQAEYDARVRKLAGDKVVEPMAPFKVPTIEEFLGEDAPKEAATTGDWSGDQGLNDSETITLQTPPNSIAVPTDTIEKAIKEGTKSSESKTKSANK